MVVPYLRLLEQIFQEILYILFFNSANLKENSFHFLIIIFKDNSENVEF